MKNLIISAVLISMSYGLGSAKEPDFRYPETVIKEATEQLAKAADDQTAIDAMVRLALAKSKVTEDCMPELINSIDSLASAHSDSRTRALLYSLEADLYTAVYKRNSYAISQRTETAGPAPADIMEWDRRNFSEKVVELAELALTDKAALQSAKAESYKKIIETPEIGKEFAPTLYDIIAHHLIEQLNSIAEPTINPLWRTMPVKGFLGSQSKTGDAATDFIASVYRELLEFHSDNPAAFTYTELQRLNSLQTDIKSMEKRIEELYSRFSDNKYSTEALIALCSIKNRYDSAFYATAKAQIARFGSYENIAGLKNFVSRYEQSTVSVTAPSCAMSANPIGLTIASANVESVTIKAYKVPENFKYGNNLMKSLDKLTLAGTETYKLNTKFGPGYKLPETQVEFPHLDYGRYLFVAEIKDPKTGKPIVPKSIYASDNSITRVTDIDLVFSTSGNEKRIYAIDTRTGEPIFQARLHKEIDGKTMIQRTNRYGYAVISNEKSFNVYATRGEDRSSTEYFYSSTNYVPTSNQLSAKILTDLAVYRPGDTMHFAAIAYETDIAGRTQHPLKDRTLTVAIKDAGRKEICNYQLITDSYGRIDSTAVIPTEGITGRFTISVYDGDSRRQLGSSSFSVSEYKAPTFYIDYRKEESQFPASGEIKLRGKVMSYSQFPIANANLSYTIEYSTFSTSETIASGTAKTDSNGYWEIAASAGSDNATESCRWYTLRISATSESGETQSITQSVKIGNALSVWLESSDLSAIASDATKIGFYVEKFATDERTDAICNYTLIREENTDTVATGTVDSANQLFDFSKVPSGKYRLIISPKENPASGGNNTASLTLYRTTDTVPPFSTPIWTTVKDVTCDHDGNFSFKIGSSYDTPIYAAIYNADKVVTDRWFTNLKGIHDFSDKAEFANAGDTRLELFAVRDHQIFKEIITLHPAVPRDSMKIVAETFRDNITPGATETWTLRLSGNNAQSYTGAMIANMYDAALNAIVPNKYYFNPYISYSYPYSVRFPYYISYTLPTSSELKLLGTKQYVRPYINMYGQSLNQYRIKIRGTMPLYYKAPNAAAAVDEVVASTEELKESVVVMDSSETADFDAGSSSQEETLRDPDVKTAFFMPALVSDSDGLVTIQFTAPDRNTQWQFSAIAYNEEMKSDCINITVTANKPLMVQPSLPRFIRCSDKAVLKASVMNNSGKDMDAEATTEIFDPETGTVISTKKHVLHILAGKSAIVETEMDADGGYRMLGYRIKAATAEFSDGEQTAFAVLPSTTDVIEAQPFYLNETQDEATVKLPKFNKDGRITIEYCDNPVWYCAISLPAVMSESQTASAIASNYYTMVTADKIVNGNPIVAQAIKHWSETNSLKSGLQKNSELKTISLGNTPWEAAAESETEMMGKLIDLTDEATMQYRKQKSLVALRDLQNADGGFSWIKGAKSSEYVTYNVLTLLGYLNESGYADKSDALASRIVEDAIGYADSCVVATIRKAKKPEDIYSMFTGYIYIRSMHPTLEMPKEIADVRKKVIADVKKNWGNYSIDGKANAAILLANCNEMAAAADIVESLRQHARKSDRGYYWDVDYADKVALASTALKAFYKVNPADPDIDNIRRWILISKETTKWIYSPAACDAINAVLTCGSDWKNSNRKAPEIKIGKEKIDMPATDSYFGYVKQTIDPQNLGDRKLTIKRESGNPSWGAVYCRYNAPMTEVEKASASDIRIEKQFFRYTTDGTLEAVPATALKVGDRLQVRLSIRTERDLNFAAITDDRPAAFEPADQLPVYEWKENACYLRETRDSSTNIFFTFIAKGTRVITYDVYVNNAGTFSSGIATLQCQYAPQIVAHSAGTTITVE